jgi:hypothetical protein
MDVSSETMRLTLLVAQALEELGIRYAVGGSLASSLHGVMSRVSRSKHPRRSPYLPTTSASAVSSSSMEPTSRVDR